MSRFRPAPLARSVASPQEVTSRQATVEPFGRRWVIFSAGLIAASPPCSVSQSCSKPPAAKGISPSTSQWRMKRSSPRVHGMRISFLSCGAAGLGSCPKTTVEEASNAIQREAARKVTRIPLCLLSRTQTKVPADLFRRSPASKRPLAVRVPYRPNERFIMRFAGIFFLVLTATAQVLTLQDGTPVRLRLERTVSSASAHVGETVDFEVTEPVINENYVVIPKGAVVLGRVTKVETKRRFGRAGALELSIDSVRLPDGGTILLRATPEKGEGDMSRGRVAATIVASPVLVWVKGKNVMFEKGTETTAYVSGDARGDELRIVSTSSGLSPDSAADRGAGPGAVLTNTDIVQMQKAGLSEEII